MGRPPCRTGTRVAQGSSLLQRRVHGPASTTLRGALGQTPHGRLLLVEPDSCRPRSVGELGTQSGVCCAAVGCGEVIDARHSADVWDGFPRDGRFGAPLSTARRARAAWPPLRCVGRAFRRSLSRWGVRPPPARPGAPNDGRVGGLRPTGRAEQCDARGRPKFVCPPGASVPQATTGRRVPRPSSSPPPSRTPGTGNAGSDPGVQRPQRHRAQPRPQAQRLRPTALPRPRPARPHLPLLPGGLRPTLRRLLGHPDHLGAE